MSNEKQETIADIINEKRTTAREIRSKTPNQYGLELAVMLEAEADRIEAAHNREMAAKDEKIASLRALVKELSNVAERFVSCKATDCEIACGDIKENCIHKKTIELVAKAREVVK